ncbi:MAG: hypothetical protein U9R50_04180 [Campylobacterota bacterium]|nr:hypothetical protein [Campylobacterota bacterium]
MKKVIFSLSVVILLMSGCTQETQNKFSHSMQNWTGTNGVVDVYAGEKLVKRFIKVDKLSTGKGTDDGEARAYRYGYGIDDQNFNHIADENERKIYFEVSTFSTYVFYENTVPK